MKLTKLQLYYLIATVVCALFFIILRKQPFEYILLLSVGLFIGGTIWHKLKVVFVLSLILWFIATFFDPVFKSVLDKIFMLDTAGFSLQSIVVNSMLLILFWIGFYVGRRYH